MSVSTEQLEIITQNEYAVLLRGVWDEAYEGTGLSAPKFMSCYDCVLNLCNTRGHDFVLGAFAEVLSEKSETMDNNDERYRVCVTTMLRLASYLARFHYQAWRKKLEKFKIK